MRLLNLYEACQKYNGIVLLVCRPSQTLTHPVILSNITSLRTITGLNQPYEVGVFNINDGQIVVTENCGNSLKVIRRYDSVTISFDIPTYPHYGVAVTQDNYILVVVDHKIYKISFDDEVRVYVGVDQIGTKPLQFKFSLLPRESFWLNLVP